MYLLSPASYTVDFDVALARRMGSFLALPKLYPFKQILTIVMFLAFATSFKNNCRQKYLLLKQKVLTVLQNIEIEMAKKLNVIGLR